MSAAKEGSRHTDDTKAKIGAAKMGVNNPNYSAVSPNAHAVSLLHLEGVRRSPPPL
jgi:hypothetical protein